MKCIKAIKETKDVAVGTIKRVDDKTANNMVGNFWTYVSKQEWKKETRKPKPKEEVVEEKNQPEKNHIKKGNAPKNIKTNNNGKR